MDPRITPDMIPHEQFHKGSWLLPVRNASWYYFLLQENINHISNKNFMDSVDEQLKDLVYFLHARGIKTTPSCSGHYRRKSDYEEVYIALRTHQYYINNEGLEMRDIETGKIYLFQEESYDLPWTKTDFVEKAMTYQQKGIIGMRIPECTVKEEITELEVEDVEIFERDGIIFLSVNEDNIMDNRLCWRKITVMIKNIFSRSLVMV